MSWERGRRRLHAACSAAAVVFLALTTALALNASEASLSMLDGAAGDSLTASIFVRDGATGYIFVAVLAFVLGVVFTVFCVRLKRHMEDKEREDDRGL